MRREILGKPRFLQGCIALFRATIIREFFSRTGAWTTDRTYSHRRGEAKLQHHFELFIVAIISSLLKSCFFCQFSPAVNSGSLVATLLVRSRNQHKPCRCSIVSRSSMTVSPRRRCKTAARISLPVFLLKAQASTDMHLEGAEPHCAESWQFGRNKQEQIRPLGSPGACVGRNRFAAYG
jgi:hypothetical protein